MKNERSCFSCFYRLICACGYEDSTEACKAYLPDEAFGVFKPDECKQQSKK